MRSYACRQCPVRTHDSMRVSTQVILVSLASSGVAGIHGTTHPVRTSQGATRANKATARTYVTQRPDADAALLPRLQAPVARQYCGLFVLSQPQPSLCALPLPRLRTLEARSGDFHTTWQSRTGPPYQPSRWGTMTAACWSAAGITATHSSKHPQHNTQSLVQHTLIQQTIKPSPASPST